MDGDKVRQVVDAVVVSVGIYKPIFPLFDPLCRAPKPVTDGNFEVGVVGVKLEVVRGSLKCVLISHEAITKSLHLFRK
jgi:hypothetical protein